jgi:hypothetical protein
MPAEWGTEAARRLVALFAGLDLRDGSLVCFDFSETRHVHFRAGALLIALARELETRGVRVRLRGLSEYLRGILELGGALEWRDLAERSGLGSPPLPSPAGCDLGASTLPYGRDPHGWVVLGLN